MQNSAGMEKNKSRENTRIMEITEDKHTKESREKMNIMEKTEHRELGDRGDYVVMETMEKSMERMKNM